MPSFSSQEIALIKKVRSWAEYQSYDSRRNYFYNVLHEIGRNPSSHNISLAYSIAQNLALDESDLVDMMCDVWGISESEIYRCV